MNTTTIFLIDGQPVLTPDAGLLLGTDDLESKDSGRDESGTLHRFLLGPEMARWEFVYDRLTAAEYAYMEGLFAGKSTFSFTCPGSSGPRVVTAYRDKHSICWDSAADGLYRDYRFRIQSC